jgi:hypothetical protein
MGCFLVMTAKDYQLIDMASRRSAAYEHTLISKVDNPHTARTEVLIKAERALAQQIQRMFPETRKSVALQSHHIFPQKHKNFFRDRVDIPIDQFTVWLDRKSHLQMHTNIEGYNKAWDQFVDRCQEAQLMPGETKQLAIQYASTLMTAFGFGGASVDYYRAHHP